jgi:hypothetical protein
VEATQKRIEKLGEKYRNETPSEGEKQRMMAASTRMVECITKLQAGEAPPPAPAAPPTPDEDEAPSDTTP